MHFDPSRPLVGEVVLREHYPTWPALRSLRTALLRLGLCIKNKDTISRLTFDVLCRDEATRTPDPYVPNVVRYQLRYIPKKEKRKRSERLP